MEELRQDTDYICLLPRFTLKLDQVIDLLLAGQLRCDIDDGLLEKLLVFFQSGCSIVKLRELLQTSKLIPFFETVLKSLDAGSEDPSSDTISFGIRALAIFLKKAEFSSLMLGETSSLASLCAQIVKNSQLSNLPTVQVAILSFFIGLASSRTGRQLLISNGFSESAFMYLGANSYYVRKEAVEFFSYFLIHHFPECSGHDHFKKQLDAIFEQLFLSVISNNELLRESCASVLKTCLKGYDSYPFVLDLKTHIMDNLYNTWSSVSLSNISSNMLNLIAVCHEQRVCCIGNHIGGHEMVELLIEKGLICEAILLSGKILLSSMCTGGLIKPNDMQVILHPVILLTQEGKVTAKANTKLLVQDKSRWTAAIQTSFASLLKLLKVLDDDALILIFDIICIAFKNFTLDGEEAIVSKLLRQKKILSLIHQLTLQVADGKYFQKVGLHQKLLLIECLVRDLKKSSDCKVTCDNLKLVSHVVQHEQLLKSYLSDQQKKSQLIDVLQLKLFDTQWPVVDSCLEVVHTVVISLKNSESSEFLQDIICTPGIHTTVWDIAFGSKADGYVRASCITLLTTLSFIKNIFEDLKHCRGISEGMFVSSLCLLSQDPDVFVQRESVSSLSQCLNLKTIKSNENIFRTFVSSVHRSLDCQVKICILDAWEKIRDAYFSNLLLNESNVFETLKFLCHLGYGFTLLCASSDCDRTVRIRAVQELLNLRKFLLLNGFSYLSVNCDKSNLYTSTVKSSYQNSNLSGTSLPSVTKEDRDKAVNDVLEMDTVNQLTKVMKPFDQRDGSPLPDQIPHENKFSCSTIEFWELLWSQGIEEVLETSERSSDMYIDNPEALLDDIIAAREESNHNIRGEYQDADCY